jgi:hypothetical protein
MKPAGKHANLTHRLYTAPASSIALALFVCVLLTRLVLWSSLASVTPAADDQLAYLASRDNLLERHAFENPATGEPTAYRDPGYSLFLSLLALLGSRNLNPIIVVQMVLSALTAALLILAVDRERGRDLGLATGLLCLLYAQFGAYSLFLYPETLYGFLLAVLLLALSAWKRNPTVLSQLAVGAAFSLLLLTRFAPFVSLAAFGVVAIGPRGTAARKYLLAALIPIAAVSLWSARNLVKVGVPAPNSNGVHNLYLGNNPRAPLTQSYRAMYDPELRAIYEGKTEAERFRAARVEVLAYWKASPSRALTGFLARIPDALELDRQLVGVARKGQFPDRSVTFVFLVSVLLAAFTAPVMILGLANVLSPASDWMSSAGRWAFWGMIVVEMITIAHPRFTIPAWILLIPGAATVLVRAKQRESAALRAIAVSLLILTPIWVRQVILR